jgi:hypothetical protein
MKRITKESADEFFQQLRSESAWRSVMESDGDDPVNHPAHYRSHPSGIEAIEITRHMRFNDGNAIKYTMRADHKGRPIQDRKKAIWYLLDEIGMMSDTPAHQSVIEQLKDTLAEIEEDADE